MKKIILIIPYFGKWPLWFEAHLCSIAANPTIFWLCPTNCELPESYPTNIKFITTSLQELNRHVNTVVSATVPLTPRKFCDLKPAYGEIFKEELHDCDFWGICDMDIIWGDIRKFITEEILNEYDIISSRKQAISGHFTLFRNTAVLNVLYTQLPNYTSLFEHPVFKWTDEVVLTNFIKEDPEFKKMGIRVYWPTILCNQEYGRDSHQEYHLDKWLWKDGQMLEQAKGKTTSEVMYLHFINWKRTMKYSEVNYNDHPQQFYISYSGIHNKLHSSITKMANRVKNLFDGYYIRLEYKRLAKKSNSYKKRFINKFYKS